MSVGGVNTRTAFAGNVIPASRINTVGKNIVLYYPLPNIAVTGALGANNYDSNAEGSVNNNEVNARIDHQLTSREKVFGRVSSDITNLCQASVYGNVASPGGASVGCTSFRNRSASLENDFIISPNVLSDVAG